jgi:hypothetical protein
MTTAVTEVVLQDLRQLHRAIIDHMENAIHGLYDLDDSLEKSASWVYANDADADDILLHLASLEKILFDAQSQIETSLLETSSAVSCLRRSVRMQHDAASRVEK